MPFPYRPIVALVAFLVGGSPLLAAPSGKGRAAPPSEAGAMAAAISAFRKAEGLGPVQPDASLGRAAVAQAAGMAQAGQMSHDVAGSFSSRIKAAGIRAYVAAENVAMGQKTAAEVLDDWKKSSGHRKNLLMAGATRIGLAKAAGQGLHGPVLYWALILAGPEPRADQPPPGAAALPTFWWGSGGP